MFSNGQGSLDYDMRIENQSLERAEIRSRCVARIAPFLTVLVILAFGGHLWAAPPTFKDDARSLAGASIAQNQSDSAVPPGPPDSEASAPQAPEGSSPVTAPSPTYRRWGSSRSVLDEGLSGNLSSYLHQHHLPFVDALVFRNSAGHPVSVKLTGEARTEHGREDAAIKSSDFLNEPGLHVQNHVEVNANLTSNAVSSGSAETEPFHAAGAESAPATAASDPCTALCLKDEGHCSNSCQTQAAGGASGGDFSLKGLLGQFGQSASQLKQCNEDCQQTREHCTYQCGPGGTEQSPGMAAPPPDGGGASLNASDRQSEGPDTPPE